MQGRMAWTADGRVTGLLRIIYVFLKHISCRDVVSINPWFGFLSIPRYPLHHSLLALPVRARVPGVSSQSFADRP